MPMASNRSTRKGSIPEKGTSAHPVLPIRDTVHFPGLVHTLLVGRTVSLRALRDALGGDRLIVTLTQKEVGVEEPAFEDLYRMGTLCEILQAVPVPDGTMRIVVRGLARFKVDKLMKEDGAYRCSGQEVEPKPFRGKVAEAKAREAIRLFEDVLDLGKQIPPEALQMVAEIEDAGQLADCITHHLPVRPETKQQVLEMLEPDARITQVLQILMREREILTVQNEIRSQVEKRLGDTQRDYYLREQLRIIQQELRQGDDRGDEIDEYARRIEESDMPPDVRSRAEHELVRLQRSTAASPESMVIRTYLDWITTLPWSVLSEDSLDVKHAKRILDRDHFGLRRVKDRVLDFLAVRQVAKSLRGPILCFVGPPGVGKTSIGKSIAEALGRKFVRISLGGVRDEAEIRGHRRTYIGSLPGRIIQGVHACGTRNPVFMLDEVDKMGMDFRGDPTSALLEALDPEQNDKFTDHYIECPFDLSAVMFITTANTLEGIPWPLRDRMEVIEFPGYTEDEKLQIASLFLVPKQLAQHGLKKSQLSVSDSMLRVVVREYTREAGVRNLEREIATLCRKTARLVAEEKARHVTINRARLTEFLGKPRYQYGTKEKRNDVGTATGLVYTEFGGDVVLIEVARVPAQGPEPRLVLTGHLGEIMKESAQTAITCVYARARQLLGKNGVPDQSDLHIHVPAGAVPKDGPSAGITIAAAYASALTGRPVRADVAMTGEITLRGKVLPVGGLREKILAAHRAGIRTVIIPKQNIRDLDDIPRHVLDGLTVLPVERFDEVVEFALASRRRVEAQKG
jgi:ATP-dependent Lon protease